MLNLLQAKEMDVFSVSLAGGLAGNMNWCLYYTLKRDSRDYILKKDKKC